MTLFDYQNASGGRRESDVMPLGLAQQGPRLDLDCHYQGFDDKRNLSNHRIRSAKVTTVSFARPRGFDLAKYDADSKFSFGEGSLRRFRMSAAHLSASGFFHDF